jgi:hypothetical protein
MHEDADGTIPCFLCVRVAAEGVSLPRRDISGHDENLRECPGGESSRSFPTLEEALATLERRDSWDGFGQVTLAAQRGARSLGHAGRTLFSAQLPLSRKVEPDDPKVTLSVGEFHLGLQPLSCTKVAETPCTRMESNIIEEGVLCPQVEGTEKRAPAFELREPFVRLVLQWSGRDGRALTDDEVASRIQTSQGSRWGSNRGSLRSHAPLGDSGVWTNAGDEGAPRTVGGLGTLLNTLPLIFHYNFAICGKSRLVLGTGAEVSQEPKGSATTAVRERVTGVASDTARHGPNSETIILRKSEVRGDFRCPFCGMNAGDLQGILCHLTSSHDRFHFRCHAMRLGRGSRVIQSLLEADMKAGVKTPTSPLGESSGIVPTFHDRRIDTLAANASEKHGTCGSHCGANVAEIHVQARGLGDLLQDLPFDQATKRVPRDARIPNMMMNTTYRAGRKGFVFARRVRPFRARRVSPKRISRRSEVPKIGTPIPGKTPEPGKKASRPQKRKRERDTAWTLSQTWPPANFVCTRLGQDAYPSSSTTALGGLPGNEQSQLVPPSYETAYHTRNSAPKSSFMDPDFDSDDESELQWIREESERLLDEFTDVTLDEKVFFKLWNRFSFAHPIISDRKIADACRRFCAIYGAKIKALGLEENMVLHLLNIWQHGLLSADDIAHCMRLFQAGNSKVEPPESPAFLATRGR